MAIEEVIRWLRTEHDDLREVADRLRERAAAPPRGGRERWIAELQARFDEFAGRLRRRTAKEEEGGYLKPVLAAQPTLSEAVDVLRHEHRELGCLLDRLEQSVHRLSPRDNFLLRDCCKRIEDLLCWLERHEEHENHLVLYALGYGARTTPAPQ